MDMNVKEAVAWMGTILISLSLLGIGLFIVSWFDNTLIQVLVWMSLGFVFSYVFWPALFRRVRGRDLPDTVKRLYDPHENNRVEAIQQLGNMLGLGRDYDRSILDGFYHIVSSSSNKEGRKAVVLALEEYLPFIYSFHARLVLICRRSPNYPLEILLKALEDADPEIRARAAYALRHTDAISTIDPLLKALHDPHDAVRKMAQGVLADGCPELETIVFGKPVEVQIGDLKHTLVNPDVSKLTAPLSHLKKVVFDGDTCEMDLVDSFVNYMERHGESETRSLKEDVSVCFVGNPIGFRSEVYQFCQQCRRVELDIETVVFGELPQDVPAYDTQTVFNPDVSYFTIPMPRMKKLIITADSYDFHQLEQFLTYAVNYLGERHLKKRVDVYIYGNPARIHSNLYNNLEHMYKRIIQY